MDLNIDPAVVSTLARAIIYRTDGATIKDIIDGFPVPPDRQTVEFWVAALLKADVLVCESIGGEKRYFLTSRINEYLTPNAPDRGVAATTTPATDTPPKEEPSSANGPAVEPERGATTASTPASAGVGSGVQAGPGGGVGAAANEPVPTGEASIQMAFDEVLPAVVIGIMPLPSAVAKLQQKAREALPRSAHEAFVQYGLDRLAHLTLGDALRHKLLPAQYEIWRRQYFAVPATRAAQPESKVESPVATSAAPVESKHGVKVRKEAPESGVEDAESGALSGVDAVAKALEPILDAVVQPATNASHRTPQSALANVPSAGAKALGRLLSARPGGKAFWGALSTLGAVVFTILKVMGWPTWLIAVLFLVATTTALGIAYLRRNARTPNPNSTATTQTTPPGTPQRKYLLAVGVAALVIAIAGTVWYVQTPAKPSKADVSAYLTNSLAPLPVRVAAIDLTFLRTGSAGCTVKYDAQIVATAPLYQRLNTAEYLRTQSAADIAAIDAASALLVADQRPGTKDQGLLSSRLAAAGAGPAPTPALRDLVLVKVQTVPGKSAHISGTPEAFWNDGAWSFSNDDVRIDPKQLGGEPKPANALAVDQSTDIGRLKSLIAEHAAYAAKVQAAATALAADLAREQAQKAAELALGRTVEPSNGRTAGSVETTTAAQRAADLEQARQQKITALNQLLQRGTFLSGMVVAVPKPDSYPVLLEVTDCSATTHQITFVLRNTSGWYNTRSGKGTWSIDADNEVCTAKVWFANDERIPGAGRPLDDTGSWYLTVRVRLDGTIAAEPRGWELQRVAADAVAAAKAEFGFAGGRTVEPSNGRTAAGAVAAGRGDQRPGTKDEGPGGAGAPSRTAAEQSFGTPITGATAARSIGVTAPDQPIDRSTVPPSAGSTSVTPLDRSTVTPIADRPLDRSTVPPPPSLASALNDLSLIAGTRTGAYALVGGQWLPLPTNSAKAVQGVAQKLTGALGSLTSWQDKLAGKSSTPPSTGEAGEIRFDGIETVPTVPAKEVVIAYVGPLTPVSADAKARYPELKDYPVMELALEKTAAKGVRYATLYRLPGGYLGFANTRVMNATIDQSTANLTVLRSTTPLPRGQYALACGDNSYEVRIE